MKVRWTQDRICLPSEDAEILEQIYGTEIGPVLEGIPSHLLGIGEDGEFTATFSLQELNDQVSDMMEAIGYKLDEFPRVVAYVKSKLSLEDLRKLLRLNDLGRYDFLMPKIDEVPEELIKADERRVFCSECGKYHEPEDCPLYSEVESPEEVIIKKEWKKHMRECDPSETRQVSPGRFMCVQCGLEWREE
jgi:hypothetical protein